VRPACRADNSAFPDVSNVQVTMVTQHSIPPQIVGIETLRENLSLMLRIYELCIVSLSAGNPVRYTNLSLFI
jgi:hypothetical protein